VAANPDPPSVEAVQVQTGFVLFAAEAVEGVPGTDGAVASISKTSVEALPLLVVFSLESVARTYIVWLPSESADAVQVNASLAELKLVSLATQLLQLPPVPSI
jgi:hypothetical protein